MELVEGRPWPLGATLESEGVNFALFSEHASRVFLCLFDEDGARELKRIELTQFNDDIWYGKVLGLGEGSVYGYRVDGPYDPQRGLRFNRNKILLDPYARDIIGEYHWGDDMFGFDRSHLHADLAMDERDNALTALKARVCARSSAQEIAETQARKPQISWADTVVYEAHVRGLTQLRLDIPAHERGTFKGLCHDSIIEHLKHVGVTALELLPCHGFIDEEFLVGHGLSNYWGYNSLNYFMPHRAYLSGADPSEFKAFVDTYHSHGIEVWLDVVYNHTAESNHLGPSLSWRGIDNLSYYRLENDDARKYVNDTGCGNTLNIEHPRVLQMVMDSLRFWAGEMGVDGFRFDLASILGRNRTGYTRSHNFFAAILQDPLLANCKMVAEPWDIGPGGYQLGNFPKPWSEWNDKYRDVIRRFWKGDPGQLPEFARRIHGSSDVFESSGRGPRSTVNFITSHDGFTMADLVSFRERHNHANKEQNRDGHHSNFSENYGVEGPTHIEEIKNIRAQQIRNFLFTLFVSQGVPMLLAGDERGNSQRGNNNAYCQDNEMTWLDWSDSSHEELTQFVSRLTALRRSEPLLGWQEYIHKAEEARTSCVRWYDKSGVEMRSEHWNDPNALSVAWSIEAQVKDKTESLLVLFNASAESLKLTLHQRFQSKNLRKLIDTAKPKDEGAGGLALDDGAIMIPARSAQLIKIE